MKLRYLHFTAPVALAALLFCIADRASGAEGIATTAAVLRVEDTVLIIAIGENHREVSVSTETDTVITLNGTAAKLSDLKEGQRVVITQVDGLTRRIEASAQKGNI